METSGILLFFLVCFEIFCPPVHCAILRVLFFYIIFKSYPSKTHSPPIDTGPSSRTGHSSFGDISLQPFSSIKNFANTSNILEENVGFGRFILRRQFSKCKFDLYTVILQTSLVSIVFHLYVSISEIKLNTSF